MLFISIMLIIWFGFWLFFQWKRNEMLGLITYILIEVFGDDEEEG